MSIEVLLDPLCVPRRARILVASLLIAVFVPPTSSRAGESAGVNQDPVAVAESVTTREDTPVTIDVAANDSDPDGDSLIVTSARMEPPVEPVRATDEAPKAGIGEVTKTWSASVTDFDRDGWRDFLLVHHNGSPAATMYRNVHGAFRKVDLGISFHRANHSCPWGDVNADGRPDIYCTLGANIGKAVKANQLWIQQPDGSFVNKAAEYGVTDPYGRGAYATFIDVNHDRFPDLYVGNDYPRQDSFRSVNRLFINEGGTSFRAATDYGLDKEVGGLCVQAADYNSDGWDDLLVCGDESLKLYRNESGSGFTDVSAAAGLSEWASAAVLVDLNGDGAPDLAESDLWGFGVRLQSGGTFQTPVAKRRVMAGEAIAAGDANGDGRQDIYLALGGAANNPDLLLLGDGTGTSFGTALIPQASSGMGDAVAPIDYDRNGTKDFIVLNGHVRIWTEGSPKDTTGPTQLISFQDANGAVKVNADGTVTYTPNRDFTGTDTFSYTISDGHGGTATATDTVTVTRVNDPVRAAGEFAVAKENLSSRIRVLANDSDADGDALRVGAISTPPAHGKAAVNTDGTVTYTPARGYVGPDSFSYLAGDGRGSRATATVTLRVIAPGGCTIQGTSNWNYLYGTGGADVICGGGDNDFVHSHGGDDILYGREDNDFLFAGPGNDRMIGGAGTDLCRDTSGSNGYKGCEKR